MVAGIGLFCGSIYVLLGTNLGARLGFLVAFTGLTGFMVILTLLWCTTASPLNTLKGRIPQWKVVEVVPNIEKAKTTEVRDIATAKNKADATEASNVKAAVDAALVTKVSTPTVKFTPNDNRFAKFDDVTKYMILQTYEIGGSKPAVLEGRVHPHAEVRGRRILRDRDPDPGVRSAASAAGVRTGAGREAGVRGAAVRPRLVAGAAVRGVLISALLFGLGLLSLHWREKDEMAAAAAKAGPVAVPARDDSELTKV